MSISTESLQNVQVPLNSSTTKKINSLLNSSKTRSEGLELLRSYLYHCSDEDFLNSCISWMQNCCKVDALTKNRDFAISLLCNLFKLSSNYQELKKSVSFFITTRYFDYFYKYFLKSELGWLCTEACLQFYRGACGPFLESLESHLRNKIEENEKVLLTVCRCYALIPCIGGGGAEGVNYKKNWKVQFNKFINVCHSILNDLFSEVEEYEEYNTLEHTYNKKENESSPEYLSIQFYNHINILNFMLLNQYPAPKSIPSDLFLELVCRGLALTPKALSALRTSQVISLEKVLPEIHATLFSLLKAAIVVCKSQLVPYSHLVCKLIKQTLEWTTTTDLGHLRIKTYETLCDWLAAARGGSCVEVIASYVVSNAVHDIQFKKEFVHLKETKVQNHGKSKEPTTRLVDITANSKICHAALKTLQFLLKFAGVLLKPEEHKFLQEVVVKLVVEIQKCPSQEVAPFGVPVCRAELYSLLMELVLNPCPNWPPPTNFALRLFSKGVNDASPQVSLVCSAALNSTTIIIHPQYDNGRFLLCEREENRTREVELRWEEEPVEELIKNGAEENVEKEPTHNEKEMCELENEETRGLIEESDVLSDEDSRHTITFSKDTSNPDGKFHTTENRTDDEPNTKKPKISISPEKTPPPSPVKDIISENETVKKNENSSPSSSKIISPELVNEDLPKKRYFLRSVTKTSSEESEEVSRRMSSPDSPKSSLSKGWGRNTPGGQRQRTKSRSRVETNSESENKTPGKVSDDDGNADDDELEDINAAFDDSFVN